MNGTGRRDGLFFQDFSGDAPLHRLFLWRYAGNGRSVSALVRIFRNFVNIDQASAEAADNLIDDGNFSYFGNEVLHTFPFSENLSDINRTAGFTGNGIIRCVGRVLVGWIVGWQGGDGFPICGRRGCFRRFGGNVLPAGDGRRDSGAFRRAGGWSGDGTLFRFRFLFRRFRCGCRRRRLRRRADRIRRLRFRDRAPDRGHGGSGARGGPDDFGGAARFRRGRGNFRFQRG